MVRLVLAFASIHDALAAEKAALATAGQARGLAVATEAELLPLPPSIKSDCGFGLFLSTIEGREAELLVSLRAAAIRYEDAYSIRAAAGVGADAKENVYERIDEAH